MDEQEFWLVWNSRGYPFRHEDRIAAESEAKRLAEKEPGTEFYVLCAKAKYLIQKPEATRIQLEPGCPF